MLPAYFSNMNAAFTSKLHFLDTPIDFGKKLGKERIFGDHKTFRGFFFGILAAIIITFIQYRLYLSFDWIKNISLLDYSSISFLLLGFLLGFGPLFGDLVKSFFKRRVGIAPGKPWPPFDQSDYVLGTLLLLLPVYIPSWSVTLTMILLSVALHFIAVFIGYLLKLRDVKI